MKKLKSIAVAFASIVIFTNITNAQNLKAGFSVNHAEPLKVKYLGDEGEYLRFEVTLQLDTPSNAKLDIEDKTGGELYSSVYSTTFKVQTFKIEKRGEQVLNFKLAFGKKTYSKSFSVNTSLVENTAVIENDVAKF